MLTILLGLLAAISWGAPDSILARGVRSIGAFPMVFASTALGAALSLPLVLVAGTPNLSTRGIELVLLVAVLTVLGFQAGLMAFNHGAVSVVAPIVSCEGGVAAALSLAAGERVGSLILVGIPLALVGVVLVSSSGGGGRGGVLPAAIAALLWGGVLALSAPLAGELGVIWAFVLVRLCAVALMAPLAVARGVLAAARTQPWPVVAWGVGDSVAYFAFVIAADRGPASVAGVLAAQFGTVGALVAVFFFGERLRRRQQVGLALVAVAVALMAAAVG